MKSMKACDRPNECPDSRCDWECRLPPQHEGEYVWRNGAEMEWECSDNCPHPSHDEDTSPATERDSTPPRDPPRDDSNAPHSGSSKQVQP